MKLQKRDWVIVALFLAIIGTNWVWYEHFKAQDISNRSDSSGWVQQQAEIGWLNHCINDNIKPCEFPHNVIFGNQP